MDTSVTQPVVADATTNPTNDVEVVPGVVTTTDTNMNGPPVGRVVRAGPRLRAMLDRSREANGTWYLLHDPANPLVESDGRPVFMFDQVVVPVRVQVEGTVQCRSVGRQVRATGWGTTFDRYFANKWQCATCNAHVENFKDCLSCTPAPPSTTIGTWWYLLHDPANPPVDSDDRPVFTFDQAVVPVVREFRKQVEGIVRQLSGSQDELHALLELPPLRKAAVGELQELQRLREEIVGELLGCFASMPATLQSMVAHQALNGGDTQLLVRLVQELVQAETTGALVTKEICSTLNGNDQVNLVLCQYVHHLEAGLGASKAFLDMETAQLEQLRKKKEDLTEFVHFFPQLEDHKMAAAGPGGVDLMAMFRQEIDEVDVRLKENAEVEVESQRMLAKAEEAVRLQEDELQDKRGKGKVWAQDEMKRLDGRIRQLLEIKSSRREATSDEDSIEAVGTYVLDALIRFVKFEGQLLGEVFGGWHDLLADLAEGGPAVVTDTSDESTRQPSLQGELSQVGDQLDHLVTSVSQRRVQDDTELGSSIPEAECAVPAAAPTATPASEHQT
jgi:hypothetical protein